MYGLCSSSFVSMIPAYIATITPVEQFGGRLGTLYFCVAIACLAGTPTAGAFVPTFSQSRFERLIVFTGVMLLASAVLIAIAYKVPPPRRQDEHAAPPPPALVEKKTGGLSQSTLPSSSSANHHDVV